MEQTEKESLDSRVSHQFCIFPETGAKDISRFKGREIGNTENTNKPEIVNNKAKGRDTKEIETEAEAERRNMF